LKLKVKLAIISVALSLVSLFVPRHFAQAPSVLIFGFPFLWDAPGTANFVTSYPYIALPAAIGDVVLWSVIVFIPLFAYFRGKQRGTTNVPSKRI
jgi:hypothetical protein